MYNIVPMTVETAADVAELEKLCFSDPWSEQSLREECENPLALWLTAVSDDGTVAGYGGIHTLYGEGEIMNIAVHPAYRRQGVAKEVLGALLDAAKDAETVFLEVRESNEGAIALYEGFGFQQITRRKHYYAHPTEDALILRWNRTK